jgi:pyruvate dehydrogenase E1 component beta subunit
MSREISYFEAVFEAEREEMGRDERVILIGEDLALYEKTGLLPGFGPSRIRSAPISENSFVGMAVGAAMTGLRPIVDLTIASFCFVAADQIVSQAAKSRYMFGGQADVPLVVRSCMWHDGSNAAHHSDREDKSLWFLPGPVPEEDCVVPFGVAAVRRRGGDATVVAIGGSVGPALEAAEELSAEGCSAEVIDPRTLVPLDTGTILESLSRTGRLVVVDPANKTCGAAAEIAAIAAEEAFDSLTAPIVRVTTPDVQIPFSPPLEKPLYPNKAKIAAALRRVLA